MTPTEKPPRITQSDIAYWMGQVDGKLATMQERLEALVKRLDGMETKQNEHISQSKNGHVPAAPGKNGEKPITFTWLVDKLLMPISLGFLYWFLFTVLPEILKKG